MQKARHKNNFNSAFEHATFVLIFLAYTLQLLTQFLGICLMPFLVLKLRNPWRPNLYYLVYSMRPT